MPWGTCDYIDRPNRRRVSHLQSCQSGLWIDVSVHSVCRQSTVCHSRCTFGPVGVQPVCSRCSVYSRCTIDSQSVYGRCIVGVSVKSVYKSSYGGWEGEPPRTGRSFVTVSTCAIVPSSRVRNSHQSNATLPTALLLYRYGPSTSIIVMAHSHQCNATLPMANAEV